MTLLLDRSIEGSKTHAFVIGVGNYPYAKKDRGVRLDLSSVPNLPSAADSAKLMCDWLLDNKDRLAAPLATLDVLISDPGDLNHRYQWNRGPVDAATAANVKGSDWYNRVVNQPGSVAFFYCCGHGASHIQQQVLFLEDLNQNRSNVWTHINLGLLALALRKSQSVSAAFLFSDACGEYVPNFELGMSQDCRFFNDPDLFMSSSNNVSLLCAAAEGQLAYEGADKAGGDLKFGRFTLALLQGLRGSSARYSMNGWGVTCRDLLDDLISLRRVFFSHWGEKEPFAPYSAVTPTNPIPIVFPDGFELPVVVMTYPSDRMSQYNFVISERNNPAPPWLKCRDAGNPGAWYTTVPPKPENILWAIAMKGDDYHSRVFIPKEPLFNQWVTVP